MSRTKAVPVEYAEDELQEDYQKEANDFYFLLTDKKSEVKLSDELDYFSN
jgi:hypothetical protein